MQNLVPRLLAISPPTGAIHSDTIAVWQQCNLDRLGLAVLVRDPHCPLPQTLDKEGRLAPLIRGCLDAGIPLLLSAKFDDLPILSGLRLGLDSSDYASSKGEHSKRFPLPSIFCGIQFRGDPSEVQLQEIRRRIGHEFLIGCSCHGEAPSCPGQLANYRCFAPVFSPHTPQKGVLKTAMGIDRLQSWCRASLPTPVLALGGISPRTAIRCFEAGAFGLAGIHQFFGPIDKLQGRNDQLSEILHHKICPPKPRGIS